MRICKGMMVLVVGALLVCSACGQDKKSGQELSSVPYFSQFTDIPIPDPATMDLDQTVLFGMQDEWLGKMTFTTPYPVSKVFDFYVDEMKKFGWKEVSIIRMRKSTLNFERGNRLATVTVSPIYASKTQVVLTMAPRTREVKPPVTVSAPNASKETSIPSQTKMK